MHKHPLLFTLGIALGLGITFHFSAGNLSALFLGGVLGAVLSALIMWIERKLENLSSWSILGPAGGLCGGLVLAALLSSATQHLFLTSPFFLISVFGALMFALPYLGLVIGRTVSKEFFASASITSKSSGAPPISQTILDTSVIIDGRITDLCQTGFLEGPFIVPQFVLQELQYISGSPNSQKRAKGQRGLDALQSLMNTDYVVIRILPDESPHIQEVDDKLVELAKSLKAKIMTIDLNLNKVARLQGISVLNIHELCHALRPMVIPGERLRVFLLKEGKEPGQGIAHLDDGTMVVVDHAKRWIGKNVDVMVTSIIQTNAGRMIFSSLKDNLSPPPQEPVST